MWWKECAKSLQCFYGVGGWWCWGSDVGRVGCRVGDGLEEAGEGGGWVRLGEVG